jgi:predicted nuclease of restriction endonuclease-like (RecB) superfamily
MVHNLSIDRQYKKWIIELKDKIRTTQIKAAMAVNRGLLSLYWELGKEICEKQEKANWGEGLIDQLAKDLSAAFPGVKGFSRANLFFIWKWYRFYRNPVQPVQNTETEGLEFVSQVVRQIPWGHNREIIMKCSNVESALFYVRETIKNNWSRTMLVLQIESKLYERQGKAIQNFQTVLPTPQADLARETLKNPYNFDFLTLGREAGERDLETALTDHIQKFLLELGQGFAYMGRQFPINVGGDDFYLNAVNAQLKHPQDQPSIGILLCKTPNKVMVEYSLENIFSPLGVSEYRITSAVPEDLKGSLPSIEALEQELGDS